MMKNQNVHDPENEAQESAQFGMLMSLALDELLDPEENVQFARDLKEYPLLAEEWSIWQQLDQKLLDEPAMEPPHDFLRTFEMRLAQQERRQRLRIGIFIGLAVILLWGSLLVGAFSLGTYILYGQAAWLTDFVHNLAWFSTVVETWFGTVTTAAGSVLAAPQARSFGMAYLSLVVAVMAVWTYFLRRSLRSGEFPVDVQSV